MVYVKLPKRKDVFLIIEPPAMKLSLARLGLGYSQRTGVTKGRMAGLSVASLKKNYFLIPLFGTMGFAISLVIGFSTRMLTKVSKKLTVLWKDILCNDSLTFYFMIKAIEYFSFLARHDLFLTWNCLNIS